MSTTKFIKRCLYSIYLFFTKPRYSLFKTIYFNFRVLPLSQAIKLPIYIYGKVSFYDLFGSVEIKAPISKGMIKLGYRQGLFSAPKGSAMIHITKNAKIIFNGPCLFDYDYAIRVTDGGVLNIGAYIGFGNDVKLYCGKYISIGDNCRIAFGNCFQDSNFHYSINTTTSEVSRKNGKIIIGERNWIGNNSYITKGTVTPDGSIVGARSYCNKDYNALSTNKQDLLIMGNPAKIIKEGFTRIFPLSIEYELDRRFGGDPTLTHVKDDMLVNGYRDVTTYHKLFE